MREQKFTSFDEKKLHLYVFDEVQNPKGVVQIIHGMQESMKTYFEFCEYLNSKGYIALGVDIRAHGKTAENLESIGVCDKPIFKDIVNDQIFLSDKIKDNSRLPLCIFGHSYGSFILQRYIQVFDDYDKVILCGSSYMKKPIIKFGKFVAGLLCKFGKAHKKAKLIESLSFKSYNKRVESGSWITADEKEAKKFYEQKENALPFENAFYKDMFSNQLKLYDKNELNKIDKSKQIFIISGEDDPIGDYTKSVKKLYEVYKKLGLNVKLKLYPNARHGLVQERNKLEIMDDIVEFLE